MTLSEMLSPIVGRRVVRNMAGLEVLFVCEFDSPAPMSQIELLPNWANYSQMIEFWALAESAKLYCDETFGQSGLLLFGPGKSTAATRERVGAGYDVRSTDELVVGEFFGESNFVIVRADNAGGEVLVTDVAYPREEWDKYPTLEEFLATYVNAFGESG